MCCGSTEYVPVAPMRGTSNTSGKRVTRKWVVTYPDGTTEEFSGASGQLAAYRIAGERGGSVRTETIKEKPLWTLRRSWRIS